MGTIITPREHEIMDIIELGKLYRPSPCPPTIAIMVDRTLCLGTGEDPNLYKDTRTHPTEEQVFKELRRRATSSWAELCERSLLADRVRLLSANGPTAGVSFVAPLSMEGVRYSDR